ncbi:MAG TPA: RNA polymerase sigma factor SigB [Bacillus sp. (in: firmicutes)]|uniref:RNA polymerase sigma factor SigB n=1 Tax=Bacillus litorisediminis TaxID=2922713 RepID=UPI001FADEC0B|nr:RNA polymerase sigma factor SigB [Bacillus litorisediminis]HWO76793.1 RNA polymerase sigma factor SigB [Bacillus sp. (in: firmicutes)]
MPDQSQLKTVEKRQIIKWIHDYQKKQDDEPLDHLMQHYKALVESIARKYSKGSSYHEDIVQVGMIGLLGAIKRYDETFNKSFESFAVPTIIGEIKRFLRDQTWSVHVPRRIKELGPKIKAVVEQLTNELERSPKIAEIAKILNVEEEEVLEAMEMGKSYQALSIDRTIEADSDGGTVTLLDLVGKPDDGFEKVQQKLVLEKVLHVLTERERLIIQYTFLENLSQKEAGEKLHISQMHVSRLQRRAIKKLQEAISADFLDSE